MTEPTHPMTEPTPCRSERARESTRSRRGPFIAAALFTGLCLATVPAAAQPAERSATTRDPAAAEALFQAAKSDAAKGDWDAACAKLRQSQDLDPAPGTAFKLAECEEQRSRIATAWALYGEVEQRLGAEDPRRELVRARISALEPRVPHLTLRAAVGAPADMSVLRDGVPLSSSALGLSLPIDPGPHTVVVRAPGRPERTFEVSLAEGEKKELELAPAAAEASSAPGEVSVVGGPGGPGETPASGGSSGLRTAGFISLGVGVAGAVLAGVTGGMLLSRDGQLKEACPAQRCTAEGVEIRDGSDGLFIANYVGWGLGIAGVGAGTVMLLLSGGKAAPTQAKVSFGATPLPGGGAALMSGRF
ncbi:uncharacterized protein CMC5_079690 [Chondromyces crocatus]|uniref:PEGA domain-containing protein n=2 Tax=Chondromyces crocatus TaxID=52 RepID=A0A0K1ESG3_CHOCO|nr:uncharacterized protein CMC5_079690 [Chondromyces crocatus]